MTEEMKALARRAVRCKHWRRMEGMAGVGEHGAPYRVVLCEDGDVLLWAFRGEYALRLRDTDGPVLPDLTDPATLGCLEHLVIEAYSGKVVLTRGNGWWSVETDPEDWDDDNCPSYAHGLVAALEAAP